MNDKRIKDIVDHEITKQEAKKYRELKGMEEPINDIKKLVSYIKKIVNEFPEEGDDYSPIEDVHELSILTKELSERIAILKFINGK